MNPTVNENAYATLVDCWGLGTTVTGVSPDRVSRIAYHDKHWAEYHEKNDHLVVCLDNASWGKNWETEAPATVLVFRPGLQLNLNFPAFVDFMLGGAANQTRNILENLFGDVGLDVAEILIDRILQKEGTE